MAVLNAACSTWKQYEYFIQCMVYISPWSLIVHCKINSFPALAFLGSITQPVGWICDLRPLDSFWLIYFLIAENHLECNKYIRVHPSAGLARTDCMSFVLKII